WPPSADRRIANLLNCVPVVSPIIDRTTRNKEHKHAERPPVFVLPRRGGAMTSNGQQPRIGVLIDADNAQAAAIGRLLSEMATYGIASIKRAYGDWTTPKLSGWKGVLNQHAIQPLQQFSYSSGKNATDS